MKAVVTGASSGIGFEISKMLITLGYEVFGIGRDFSKIEYDDEKFIKIESDLSKKNEILKLKKLKNISILVNSAGVGYFGGHEQLSIENIQEMIQVNLTAPLIISRLFLNDLKKNSGYIFNINSISALKPAIFGAVYGASKAGLRHFGNSLFNEARKSGLKVVNINPDITKTAWFDNLNFSYSDDPQSYIEPKSIAKLIKNIIELGDNTVISDITIEPQKFQLKKKTNYN